MNTLDLGKKIQDLRKLKGISQEELADRTQLSVRTIQRIEKGETDPRNFTLQAIASALEVEIKDLIEEEIQLKNNDDLERTWLGILHISGLFILIFPPLIIWLLKKDEFKKMNQHGKDVLNFQLSMVIYLFSASILLFIIIGLPILIFLGIFSTFIIIINTVKVMLGNAYRYPLTIRIIK